MTLGLRPRQDRLLPAFKYVPLEKGLIVGGILLLGGLAMSLMAVLRWRETEYGPLDVQHMFRRVLPAGLAINLGTQTVFASFFLSLMGLDVRQLARTVDEPASSSS